MTILLLMILMNLLYHNDYIITNNDIDESAVYIMSYIITNDIDESVYIMTILLLLMILMICCTYITHEILYILHHL